jgi:hypothetical protein
MATLPILNPGQVARMSQSSLDLVMVLPLRCLTSNAGYDQQQAVGLLEALRCLSGSNCSA